MARRKEGDSAPKYPYAVVENENRDSWDWFLGLLDGDIGISENQYAWTFMSDKQKGLVPSFESLFPDAENRFCVRHLHTNMKRDGFSGQSIKNAIWAAARATRIEEFNLRMDEMKKLDESAFNWLVKKVPSQWSRSHFSPIPKCDILLNNMCESFNSMILPARDKPIITMLEIIINLLMTRLQVNREKARGWNSIICPKIKKVLEKNMKEAAECIPMKSDDWHFQIIGPFDQHNVDLSQNSCSCRRWDLTGIPCKHGISAIWCKNEDPEMYVHDFYKVKTYLEAYKNAILWINGSELWPKCDLPAPLPPNYESRPGRPKKVRRREPDEPPASSNPSKLRKTQKSLKYRKCGVIGHNARTCKNRGNASSINQNVASSASPEEINVGSSQPNIQSSQQHVVQASTTAAIRKQKLPVRKNLEVNIRGNSNHVAPLKVNRGSNVSTPVIVKGGSNFVTISNIQMVVRSHKRKDVGEGSAEKGKNAKK